MAFLSLKIYFSDDDWEEKENLKVPIKRRIDVMVINTNHICSYCSNDSTQCAMLRMANGEIYETTIPFDEFEDILSSVESIFDLTKIIEN